jgi:hypothetical protein
MGRARRSAAKVARLRSRGFQAALMQTSAARVTIAAFDAASAKSHSRKSLTFLLGAIPQREAGANAKVIEGEAEVVPSLPAPGSGGTKMPKA